MFKKITAISLAMFFLSGCGALPPAFSYLSYTKTAADAVNYISSQKSITDHAISVATDKDCALHRALNKEDICVPKKEEDHLKTEW